jgi:hypothetical protein
MNVQSNYPRSTTVDSTNVERETTCLVCHEAFSYTVRPGRPPGICGEACRAESRRVRLRRYYKTLTDARDQLAALQAAA